MVSSKVLLAAGLSLSSLASTGAVCLDSPAFLDENGNPCSFYAGTVCKEAAGLSLLGLRRVIENCQLSCDTCVKANDICEVGVGGDRLEVPSVVSSFDIIDEPFLTDVCNWIDTPEGLRQTTNAWGNLPGENQVMGCMAIVKGSFYTDFVMEFTGRHDDDDASGIIFGMDPNNPDMYYKSMMFNDDWLEAPSDSVQGPFLKINKRNGKPCNGTMSPETDCFDLLAYTANDAAQNSSMFPGGSLSSVDYFPDEYAQIYEEFTQHNKFGKIVTFTLIVLNGEARAYYNSKNGRSVATWVTLPADYAGGMVGVHMAAHQATFESITVIDLSPGATPMSNLCKFPGATCDTTLGLCIGGPTSAPSATPSMAPTFFENCQDPYRHPASEFCPNPVGGNVVTYDTTTLDAFEFIDQDEGTLSDGPCAWSADAAGLFQSSNAWGNGPPDLMLGCIALIPDTYTDFIAEYDAVHFDNDAWGFVFGYKSATDHYTALTHNGNWPNVPLDDVPGPFTKIRKMNGKPCIEAMTKDNFCSETLGFTNVDGFSDNGNVREMDAYRGKEYEYTHQYEANANFQAHKITLIVKDQEARVLYKTPDTFRDTPINALRQGQRYQAAMTLDLKDYSGGRVGIFMSAHQMIASNFKITDISDPVNLPTAYCGDASFCDAGATGLCLGVAASGVCEGAVGGTSIDVTDLSVWEFIDDPGVNNGGCSWAYGPNGNLYQGSNANNNDGTLLGCSALLPESYTDFMMEMTLDNLDDDGIGFTFGWKDLDNDHFRVHKINDVWPFPNADFVQMPVMKIRKRIAGASCLGIQNSTNGGCYETIAFIDNYGPFHNNMPAESVIPAGECGYSNTFLSYDQADTSKMYMIVKDNQIRATYESPLSRRQVTVMNFDLSKHGYDGGRVGIFMAAHQAEFYEIKVSPLSGPEAVTQFCGGEMCSERTGRCLGGPTMSPTFVPTGSPTLMPTPNVAANDYCQGPVSATATTLVDTSDISQFLVVDHPMLTTSCDWSAAADGLTQNSLAWGNSPGDNTLMGCMAMFTGAEFTDFIAEIDVSHVDNDGWGVVFGYKAIDDHYLGIAMNDRWPVPAADGIPGPFLKMKKHNGKPVLGNMDASNTCFDTLSHVDSKGFNRAAMEGGTGVGIPKEYSAKYPYRIGSNFENNTKIVLIVKDGEARLYYPTPAVDRGTVINSLRQSQTVTSTWTFDIGAYAGGQVGVFTYAHQATFSNWKITDLTDPTQITDYCDGHPELTCDNQRGDASTGLCMGVPAADVCEGPVGDGVMLIDTAGVLNQDVDFEFVQDPGDLTDNCTWGFGPTGHLYQSTNAYSSSNGLLLGCHALVLNLTVTDFLMQVDIGNDDDDAVGFSFGWKSLDDHFKCYKMNDDWPNPSADALPGPIMKVVKKIPGLSCDAGLMDETTACYQALAFVDQYGVSHGDMPMGAIQPFEYAKAYAPYERGDVKRLVLIVRDNALRLIYQDVDNGNYVGNFIFDMAKYGYTGGRVGLHVAAHQAEFSDYRVAPLSGPDAVTQFCNGGTCDTRLGTCTTQPTSNPTSRMGDVPLADICPGPVGGATVVFDTTDISLFTFVDQEPVSEPCAWSTTSVGLYQAANSWGNYPGDSTALGCVAIIGTDQYTDFMIEVEATHDDDDAWGFVFGYQPPTGAHFVTMVNNDKWPDPPMDGVRGPFSKFKVSTDKPCIAAPMNATADNRCYETLSYSDYLGRFNVDGEEIYDLPGEYHRTYPFKVDESWPNRKLTLVVKDGSARLQVMGPEKDFGTVINNMRQPTQYLGMWTNDLAANGYVGGQVGLFVYAHQATFFNLKITDLSDASNLPTDYCDGSATCAKGACVAVAAPGVCEDPVGATVFDLTSTNAFEYVDDPLLQTECDWVVSDLGSGPFLYQSTNAYGGSGIEALGCNAVIKGKEYTSFVMQFDVDNYDNDGVGFVFGWKSEMDHFKIYKRIDQWPAPSDFVEGPHLKVIRRNGDFNCMDGMNYTNQCYDTVAFADYDGRFYQAMPANTVAPWQYAPRYYDYEIGRGTVDSRTTMVLIVKDNQLRTYFSVPKVPDRKISAMAFDLGQYGYDGGRVGMHMYAHQAQFFDVRIAPLDGNLAATEFCATSGTCNAVTGLCE